jgi:hypothetical protein
MPIRNGELPVMHRARRRCSLLHRSLVAILIAIEVSYAAAAQAQQEPSREVPSVEDIASARAKIMAEYAGSLALAAAVWGAPLVTMHALRITPRSGPAPRRRPIGSGAWRISRRRCSPRPRDT